MRSFSSSAYGIYVHAWKFITRRYYARVVGQIDASGMSVADARSSNDGVFAINGGFFEIDARNRLTPSGILIIDGRRFGEFQPSAGSGVLSIHNGFFEDRLE